MGWTCQHDHQGHCNLLKKDCVPGMKGCVLKRNNEGIIFSSELHQDSNKEEASDTSETSIDFAALARSH